MNSAKKALLTGFPFEAFTRDIWLICLSNVIGAFGEGLYFWGFPLYIRSLQADYVQLGIVFSSLMGAAALAPLFGGFLTDRFDRKKILLFSWALWVFAPLIYSFAENWTQVIPGAIFWGASMLGLPALTAYVATAIKDKKRLMSVLAFVWSSYSFSYIFAPATGGYLATVIGMRWVLLLSASFSAVSTAVFLFISSQRPQKPVVEIDPEPKSAIEENSKWRKVLIWAGFLWVTVFFISIARPYVPTFLDEQINLSEFYVGMFGSVNYAGITFLGIALGALGDRWRKSGAISLSLVFYIASVVPILLVRETTSLMFVAFVFGGSAVSSQLVSSFVGTIAPRTKQGRWISVPQALSSAAGFIAPYVGGYLYTSSPYYAFIVSVSGIPFLVLFALLKLHD